MSFYSLVNKLLNHAMHLSFVVGMILHFVHYLDFNTSS